MITKNILNILTISTLLQLFSLFSINTYSQENNDKPKRILILHSLKIKQPWVRLFNESIINQLRQQDSTKYKLEIEGLDSVEFNNPSYNKVLKKLLLEKYDRKPPDALIITFNSAANFIKNNKLFENIPKILILPYASSIPNLKDFITVPLTFELKSNIEHGLTIFPETKDIYVIAGNSQLDRDALLMFINDLENFDKNITFHYLTDLSEKELLEKVSALPDKSFIYYISYTREPNGRPTIGTDTCRKIGEMANRPVFASIDVYVFNTGILGGRITTTKRAVSNVIQILEQLFAGTPLNSIKSDQPSFEYVYEWTQLQKWHIKEKDLPKESTILNKEYSLFDTYKWHMFTIFTILLIETVLIFLLLYNIRRKRDIEKKIHTQQNRLEKVIETLPVGIWITDKNGNITYGNKSGKKIWAGARFVGPEEFGEYKAWWRDTGKLLTKDEWAIARAIKNKEESRKEELEIECFDGTHKIILNWGVPILGPDGEVEGAIALNEDISEKIMLENERQRNRNLEAIGLLAGGIAHDFNNIIGAILGNISLITMDNNIDNEKLSILSNAEKACLRARDLTQQLLTFAKGGNPIRKSAFLEEVIRDSANFVLTGSKVACNFNFPEDLWPVFIDKGQIAQVIQNIVQNAGQSMPEGGTVKISCSNFINLPEDNIPLTPEQRLVKIVIEDNGPGISKEKLDLIFTPYFSTKNNGRGLGLTITQSIVNKHNGHISVSSTIGKGTTFTIYIPASKKDPPYKIKNSTEDINKLKILFMDDDEMIRKTANLMLSKLGHSVTLSTDGEDAIDIYTRENKTNQPFDVVIMDLTVPGKMGGEEAVKKVLEINPKAKVIAASGYSTSPIMSNFEKYGFYYALNKPISIDDYKKALSEIIKST